MMAEEEATELAVTAASASVPPLDNVASESERIMMTRGVASGVPVALESADKTAPGVMTMAEMAGTMAPVEVMMTEKATEMAATASSARSGCIKKLPLINSSKPDFLNLPTTDKEVHSIDATDGLWVKCSICDSSITRKPILPVHQILFSLGNHSLLVAGLNTSRRKVTHHYLVLRNKAVFEKSWRMAASQDLNKGS